MRKRDSIFLVNHSRPISGGPMARLLGIGLVLSLGLAFVVQLFHFRMNPAAAGAWVLAKPGLYFISAVALFCLLHLWFATTGSFGISCVLTCFMTLFLSYVDYLMLYYRREPFVPRELSMVFNVSSLTSMISAGSVAAFILAVAGLTGLALLLYIKLPKTPLSAGYRLVGGGVSLLLLVSFCTSGLPGSPVGRLYQGFGANFTDYNAFAAYDANGYLNTFFHQIAAPVMDKPSGYSREAVEDVVARYRESALAHNSSLPRSLPGSQPHIIYVMSEAFSDPTRFSSLAFSQDPIPGIRGVMEEYPSGFALTPGYGGGTAHCEFEALTGFSTALYGGLSPFENTVSRQESFPSAARALAAEGYATVALHPYHSGMYDRPEAYRALGFQQFYTMDEMRHTHKLDNNDYISDSAAYQEVLDILEETQGPVFLHLVTMQNHGGYSQQRFENTITVEGMADPKATHSLETYAQGLHYTDQATVAFLEALEGLEEDVVVLFWGDHLPMGYPRAFIGDSAREAYETPFFIWSSFPVENYNHVTYSPIFFNNRIAVDAGVPLSPFGAQLSVLEEELHGIHLKFWIDGDNRLADGDNLPPRARELLEEYRLIQYDMLVGEQFSAQAGHYLYPDQNSSA